MVTDPEEKYFHRRFLPHIDIPGLVQGITFRLVDSMPKHLIDQLLDDAGLQSKDHKAHELIEKYADKGYGACWLRDPRIALLVQNAFFHFDGIRYNLIAWIIMPNHAHVIIQTYKDWPLGKVIGPWKSYTARRANKILNRSGRFWYPEYYDRYMRDGDHLEQAISYIHDNPVMAGLVEKCSDWEYSSFKKFYGD